MYNIDIYTGKVSIGLTTDSDDGLATRVEKSSQNHCMAKASTFTWIIFSPQLPLQFFENENYLHDCKSRLQRLATMGCQTVQNYASKFKSHLLGRTVYLPSKTGLLIK